MLFLETQVKIRQVNYTELNSSKRKCKAQKPINCYFMTTHLEMKTTKKKRKTKDLFIKRTREPPLPASQLVSHLITKPCRPNCKRIFDRKTTNILCSHAKTYVRSRPIIPAIIKKMNVLPIMSAWHPSVLLNTGCKSALNEQRSGVALK
jgi:hypothetical protein